MALKYKVGDRVRIKSIDWYNKNKDKHGIVICGMMPFCGYMSCRCGTIVTISGILEWGYTIEEDYGENGWTDEMIEGLVEEEIIDIDDFQDDNEIIDVIDEYVHRLKNNECQINLPEGYQFTDENGNVINAMKIVLEKKKPNNDMTREEKIENAAQAYIDSDNAVLTYSDGFCEQTDFPFVRAAFKKGVEWADNNVTQDDCSKAPKLTSQDYSNGRFGYRLPAGFEAKLTERELILTPEKKEYPKTFRECQKYLGEDVPPMEEPVSKTHRRRQVHLLEVLLICRDAYWKIAGDEMGLGKPWEPDWGKSACYTICCDTNRIVFRINKFRNTILTFPTTEMRDAFYENFKELINECKDLL